METVNERCAKLSSLTYAEIDDIKEKLINSAKKDERPVCPFCGKDMARMLKPYPEPHIVFRCNGYLDNESHFTMNPWCDVQVSLTGEVDFGYAKELLI